jgi:hypothetical protein
MAVTKKKKELVPALAFQGSTKDGKISVVGIGNLRVVIIKDDDLWFAQGLEIDYAAQGQTIEDVKKHFEGGLAATVHEHLRVFGDIGKLLKVAPAEVWNEFLMGTFVESKHYSFDQVTVHKLKRELQSSLPFIEGIQYIEAKRAAAY